MLPFSHYKYFYELPVLFYFKYFCVFKINIEYFLNPKKWGGGGGRAFRALISHACIQFFKSAVL